PALLAGPAAVRAARRAVGGALVVGVSEAAVAAVQEHRSLAGLHEVQQHGLAVLVEHLRPHGDAQHQRRARAARAVAAGAAAAVLAAPAGWVGPAPPGPFCAENGAW